jgi:hypothetical protein
MSLPPDEEKLYSPLSIGISMERSEILEPPPPSPINPPPSPANGKEWLVPLTQQPQGTPEAFAVLSSFA